MRGATDDGTELSGSVTTTAPGGKQPLGKRGSRPALPRRPTAAVEAHVMIASPWHPTRAVHGTQP